ncbi:MAG: hypothetical protein WDM79_08310 [Terricaulis sp.]
MEAAERALALDPDCPQAFVALSLLKPGFGAYAEKISLVDQALQRTPNDPALHVARAAWLYGVGRISDALSELQFAAHLDPLGPAVESLRAEPPSHRKARSKRGSASSKRPGRAGRIRRSPGT